MQHTQILLAKSTLAYGFSAPPHPLHRTGSYGTRGTTSCGISLVGVTTHPNGTTHFDISAREFATTFHENRTPSFASSAPQSTPDGACEACACACACD